MRAERSKYAAERAATLFVRRSKWKKSIRQKAFNTGQASLYMRISTRHTSIPLGRIPCTRKPPALGK
ncbi:MAG: hypothetical protein JNL43_10345 [Flavobacteriales bacterium]|nr:hypothetical protein [Flavobacteriales bacterium]